MSISAVFQRGETIRLVLDVLDGTIAGITLTAKLKDSDGALTDFVVSDLEDDTGWYITIPAGVSAALKQGAYTAHGTLTFLSGDVEKTEALQVWIEEAA